LFFKQLAKNPISALHWCSILSFVESACAQQNRWFVEKNQLFTAPLWFQVRHPGYFHSTFFNNAINADVCSSVRL